MLRSVLQQVRWELLTYRRDPSAVLFTLALPVMFLVLFVGIFGNVEFAPGLRFAALQVPGFVVLGVTSATFLPLCIGLVEKREAGTLKRLRGTPLPASHFVAGVVGASAVLSVLLTAVLVTTGVVGYDVGLLAAGVPGALLALLLGGATMSALGVAMTGVVGTPQAANAVANLAVLPLYFISGVFIQETQLPPFLLRVADVFPVRAFFQALKPAFDPRAADAGVPWDSLAILLAWCVVGLAVAARTFRWEPARTGEAPRPSPR